VFIILVPGTDPLQFERLRQDYKNIYSFVRRILLLLCLATWVPAVTHVRVLHTCGAGGVFVATFGAPSSASSHTTSSSCVALSALLCYSPIPPIPIYLFIYLFVVFLFLLFRLPLALFRPPGAASQDGGRTRRRRTRRRRGRSS
jgi:hypothetical protein